MVGRHRLNQTIANNKHATWAARRIGGGAQRTAWIRGQHGAAWRRRRVSMALMACWRAGISISAAWLRSAYA
jgi:hypothetical protein